MNEDHLLIHHEGEWYDSAAMGGLVQRTVQWMDCLDSYAKYVELCGLVGEKPDTIREYAPKWKSAQK